MKRLSGGITDLKADLLKSNFILFFLIFSSISFSQIPINGFCSQKNFAIPKDYVGTLSADLNSDGSDELIFYSSSVKKLGIYSGIQMDSAVFTEYQINSEISQLKKLKGYSKGFELFAAIERKNRKISLIEISGSTEIIVKNQIEFDSYPENIATGDINSDGKEDILVSGSGFDGLSILTIGETGIGESKVITGVSYSEALLVDFSDDGFLDIVAFDILENSLQFFVNNTNGEFRLKRSIRYKEKINFLRATDFNNDSLIDFVYSPGSYIEILYGDYQTVFNNKISIKLENKPTGLVIGDFNGDKLPDLSYSLGTGTVNILFAKKDIGFYESVTYLKNNTSSFITKFKSGGNDNLASLEESGEVKVISTVKYLNNYLKIVPAIKAGAIKKFDFAKDGIPDLCFIDEYDKYLKIFISDKAGIPTLFYYFPVVDDHKEIIIGDFFSELKTFYCYTEGIPLLEVFNFDFKINKLNRKQLYAPGEILDLNLQRVDSSLVNVYLAYNKGSRLHMGRFENRGLSITFKEFPVIDRNVKFAKIRINNEPEIFYWKSESDSFYFKSADIVSGPNILSTYFSIGKSDDLTINLYAANFYNLNNPTVVSFVQNDSEKYMLIFAGDTFGKFTQYFSDKTEGILKFGRGFFGDISAKGVINFTVNTIDDDYISTLNYNERDRKYTLSRTIQLVSIYDYIFIKAQQKNYLFYSNTEGELSISLIKK